MRRTILRRATLVAAVAGLMLLPSAPAFAHGEVVQGDLALTVGFVTEPAVAGQPNAVQLIAEHGGEPVTDLRAGDVQVEITFGGQTSEPMDMRPAFFFEDGALVFGEPGDYHADFVPSQAGKYTFHFTGTIDGERIDEEMTSGPATFSAVEDAASMSFPEVTAPTNEQLATRIEEESDRSADGFSDAEAAVASAENAASSARTLAMVGVVLGALGIVAAIAALAWSRRSASTGA